MKAEDLKARFDQTKNATKAAPKIESPAEEQTEMQQANQHPMNLLAAKVFADIVAAHRRHLLPKKDIGSDAEHRALEYFYTNAEDAIDSIIEVDQGMYGLIGDYTPEDIKPDNFADHLRMEAQWIELNREKFSKCAAVLALIDDLTAIYLRTSFRLTNLK